MIELFNLANNVSCTKAISPSKAKVSLSLQFEARLLSAIFLVYIFCAGAKERTSPSLMMTSLKLVGLGSRVESYQSRIATWPSVDTRLVRRV